MIMGFLIIALGQQAFTPPLPPGTTVCIDGLPDCFAAKVTTYGPSRYSPYNGVYGETMHELPRTREWFLDYEAAYHYFANDGVYVTLETKATSTSAWVNCGTVNSNNPNVIRNVSDGFLWFIEIDFDDFYVPIPSPL
jgi:hypothetical protein